MRFQDRREAGRFLAGALEGFVGGDTVVIGLPRGGIPVAVEVARALRSPLDAIVVRKVGVPWQPDLAMGAVAEGRVRDYDAELIDALGVSHVDVERRFGEAENDLGVRVSRYRRVRPALDLRHRTALIIDDGVATGSTARAACRAARVRGASEVVLAIPVGPSSAIERFGDVADQVLVAATPEDFGAVDDFYEDFTPVDDDVVVDILEEARNGTPVVERPLREFEVEVGSPPRGGLLMVPADPRALVVFVHGTDSSHRSPRNTFVAHALGERRIASLQFDLLADDEIGTDLESDVQLAAQRVVDAARWATSGYGLERVPVGLFGSSSGAAAALIAATEPSMDVRAVVTRGGRPEYASAILDEVRAPTLLIVGECDPETLRANRLALILLTCEASLRVIPGASHLFAEPGTLESATAEAIDWFERWLV